jgi:hypothetical protein
MDFRKKYPQVAIEETSVVKTYLEARMGYVTKMFISDKVLIVFHNSDGKISKYTGK